MVAAPFDTWVEQKPDNAVEPDDWEDQHPDKGDDNNGNGDGEHCNVPAGGTAGQVLTKVSDEDCDTFWSDIEGLDTILDTDRLWGRDAPGSGPAGPISVGGGLEFTGADGIQRSALTGDVQADAGSNETLISFSLALTGAVERTLKARLEERCDVRDFGALGNNVADDGPAFQKAIDAAGSGKVVYIPGGNYRIATPLSLRNSYFCMVGDGAVSKINWDNASQYLFTVGKTDLSPLLNTLFANFAIAQVGPPSAGGFFRLDRCSLPIFFGLRTDNAFLHYDCRGITRPIWSACLAFGNTLWPLLTLMPGSAIVKLREFENPVGTFQWAANVKIVGGTEMAGNHIGVHNYAHIIDAGGYDGFFTDSTCYFGHSKTSVFYNSPEHAASALTNLHSHAFVDANEGCGYEFTEPSPGFAIGTVKSFEITGIVSNASLDGIRINILNMERVSLAVAAINHDQYGLRIMNGMHVDAGKSMFDANILGDIALTGGSWFTMNGGQCFSGSLHFTISGTFDYVYIDGVATRNAPGNDVSRTSTGRNMTIRLLTDKTNVIASVASLSFLLGQDVYKVTGTTTITNVATSVSSCVGRMVTLVFDSVITMIAGSNLVLPAGVSPKVFGPGDIATLVCIDGTVWNLQERPNLPLSTVTAASTSLGRGDIGKMFGNTGASARTDFLLPVIDTLGQYLFGFVNRVSFGLRIVAAAGQKITVHNGTSPVAGYVESLIVNSNVTLKAVSTTEWVAIAEIGIWSVPSGTGPMTAVFTTTTDGLAPKSVAIDTTKFLRTDGSWAVPSGTGTGLANAYATVTDGVNAAAAAGGADTFKIRSSDASISITVANNDATHGDNVNLQLNPANALVYDVPTTRWKGLSRLLGPIADGTLATDAVTKAQLDAATSGGSTAVAAKVDKGGDAMTGSLMVAGGAADVTAGLYVSAPYVRRTYEGLLISRFLTSNSISVDQSAQVLNAFTELFTDAKEQYQTLDFEGRTIPIAGTLSPTGSAGSSTRHKWIQNGRLTQMTDLFTPPAATIAAITTAAVAAGDTFLPVPTVNLEVGMQLVPPAGLGVQANLTTVPRCCYVQALVPAVVGPPAVPEGVILSYPVMTAIPSGTGFNFFKWPVMLDFRAVTGWLHMNFRHLELACNAWCGGMVMPPDTNGSVNRWFECYFSGVKGRGIIAPMPNTCFFDLCNGSSNDRLNAPNIRQSIFANIGGDSKISRCQLTYFGICFFGDAPIQYWSNHNWQGFTYPKDLPEHSEVPPFPKIYVNPDHESRTPFLVIGGRGAKSVVSGNYIDNSYLEITDELSLGDGTGAAMGSVMFTDNRCVIQLAHPTPAPGTVPLQPGDDGYPGPDPNPTGEGGTELLTLPDGTPQAKTARDFAWVRFRSFRPSTPTSGRRKLSGVVIRDNYFSCVTPNRSIDYPFKLAPTSNVPGTVVDNFAASPPDQPDNIRIDGNLYSNVNYELRSRPVMTLSLPKGPTPPATNVLTFDFKDILPFGLGVRKVLSMVCAHMTSDSAGTAKTYDQPYVDFAPYTTGSDANRGKVTLRWQPTTKYGTVTVEVDCSEVDT